MGINVGVNLVLPEMTWTGDAREDNTTYCIFNDWNARDRLAKLRGTYNRRFSRRTPFGTWYCYSKR